MLGNIFLRCLLARIAFNFQYATIHKLELIILKTYKRTALQHHRRHPAQGLSTLPVHFCSTSKNPAPPQARNLCRAVQTGLQPAMKGLAMGRDFKATFLIRNWCRFQSSKRMGAPIKWKTKKEKKKKNNTICYLNFSLDVSWIIPKPEKKQTKPNRF